mgnify:CR=1 FL=1
MQDAVRLPDDRWLIIGKRRFWRLRRFRQPMFRRFRATGQRLSVVSRRRLFVTNGAYLYLRMKYRQPADPVCFGDISLH